MGEKETATVETPDLERVIDMLIEAALEIGSIQTRNQQHAKNLHKGVCEVKGAYSQYDAYCQSAFIAAAIKYDLEKTCGLIAEEDTTMVPYFNGESRFKLVIDPIDGTRNYIQQKSEFGTSMGLLEGDQFVAGLIYCPNLDAMFYAVKGEGTYSVDTKSMERKRVQIEAKDLVKAHVGYKVSQKAVAAMNFDGIETQMPVCAVYSMCSILLGNANTFSPMGAFIWDLGPGILAVTEAGGYCSQRDWLKKEEKVPLCVIADSEKNSGAVMSYIKPTGGA